MKFLKQLTLKVQNLLYTYSSISTKYEVLIYKLIRLKKLKIKFRNKNIKTDLKNIKIQLILAHHGGLREFYFHVLILFQQ